jgi:hypothetical protein
MPISCAARHICPAAHFYVHGQQQQQFVQQHFRTNTRPSDAAKPLRLDILSAKKESFISSLFMPKCRGEFFKCINSEHFFFSENNKI